MSVSNTDEVSKLADAILGYFAWRQRQKALRDEAAKHRRRRKRTETLPASDRGQE
jgi:hypothetical protein